MAGNNTSSDVKKVKAFFTNSANYVVAGVALILIAAIVLSSLAIGGCAGKNGGKTAVPTSEPKKEEDPGVIFYGFTDKIDYSAYTPAALADKLLKNFNGIAFQEGKQKVYVNGEYRDVSGVIGDKSICTYSDKVMTVDAGLLGSATGLDCGSGNVTLDAVAEKLGKEAFIYEKKLCVLLDKGSGANVFDDYYTFEMISMLIRDAEQENLDNALVNLPDTVSNNSGYTVKYTDSDLELGLSTEIYGTQGYGKGLETGKTMPVIIAGEGRNSENHTLIRVFNRYSAKTAQFLAFSADVKGGVRVAAAKVDGRIVVAASAFDGRSPETKSVKVFDEYGMPYMVITPEFKDRAPYVILTGDFDGSCQERLLVAAEKADSDGNIPFAIYSLKEIKLISTGTAALGASAAGHEIEIAKSTKAGSADGFIVTDRNSNEVYRGTVYAVSEGTGSVEFLKVNFNIDGTAAFVAQSAFSEDSLIVSIAKDSSDANRSYIRVFGGEDDVYGDKIDIGVYENIFYWYTVNSNMKLDAVKGLNVSNTDYIKSAEFQHIRTDLAGKIITVLSQKRLQLLAEANYSDWRSTAKIRNYSKSYNVWEPCFTHRFNITSSTQLLANVVDENGFKRYLGYTNANETANYVELDSQFYNATYAEGIIELDKMRIYPLRTTLQDLYSNFTGDPEKLVGLEPIHEIEINVGETFGDYNPNNIEGFRSYLLERFGSIENINNKFGTSFKSREDIDAPRNGALGNRGSWDRFSGAFFEQWALFTRKIVNKRLTEAFREALLAGFPSEIISGHSIPEGDAISGFLGQADTRMSPVDAMMTLGCHFGATRYGMWFQDDTNFLNLAFSAGFKNVTMGEYNSMTSYKRGTPQKQLEYVWSHGGKYINILNISDEGTAADIKSVAKLIEQNNPRPGYAGGTGATLAVKAGEKSYQLVELGDDETGLLKSVDANGNWTGDVYLVPFHSHVAVENIALGKEVRKRNESPLIGDLQTGDVIELNFLGSYTGSGSAKMVVEFFEDGIKNERMSAEFEIGGKTMPIKYTLSNQVPLGAVKIQVSYVCDDYAALKIDDISLAVERESIARKYFGDYTAEAHKGGFTFDVAGESEKLY